MKENLLVYREEINKQENLRQIHEFKIRHN